MDATLVAAVCCDPLFNSITPTPKTAMADREAASAKPSVARVLDCGLKEFGEEE